MQKTPWAATPWSPCVCVCACMRARGKGSSRAFGGRAGRSKCPASVPTASPAGDLGALLWPRAGAPCGVLEFPSEGAHVAAGRPAFGFGPLSPAAPSASLSVPWEPAQAAHQHCLGSRGAGCEQGHPWESRALGPLAPGVGGSSFEDIRRAHLSRPGSSVLLGLDK